METAKALGATEICLTSHHTGGFALFQTNHTSYGIKESPYQDGKGDIVREFTTSCRKYGISPCLYFINAWDCWEAQDSPQGYMNATLGMLSDLMNQETYGKIDRFWFDQYGFGPVGPQESPHDLFPAAWPTIVEHVRKASPDTLMIPGPDGCITSGEAGDGAYPVVNYVEHTLLCSYPSFPHTGNQSYYPDVNGQYYVPFESDLSIQNPGDAWFWHKGHVFDSASNLWAKYLATAGRGSHFILNVPPNTTGIIPEEFVESVRGMGDAVRYSFGLETAVGSMAHPMTEECSNFEAVVTASGTFDTVVLQEDQTNGQKLLGYTLDVQDVGTKVWTPVKLDPKHAGQTVGLQSIALLEANVTQHVGAVRFRCVKAMGDLKVSLSRFSLHTVRPPSL